VSNASLVSSKLIRSHTIGGVIGPAPRMTLVLCLTQRNLIATTSGGSAGGFCGDWAAGKAAEMKRKRLTTN